MKTTTVFGALLVLVMGTSGSGVVLGQSADAGLVECTHVADKNARLRCYDDRMTRLGHKIGAEAPVASKPPPAAASGAAPAAAANASARTSEPVASSAKQPDFGASPELLRKKRAAEGTVAHETPQELVARVKSVSARAHGEIMVELDNDQVWIETQHSSSSRAPVAGETVTIKHGTLGSFFLSGSSGPALRVKRIR